jgi:hypothetical protein
LSGERSGAKSFEREFVNPGYRRELDAAFSPVLGLLRDEVCEGLIRTAVDCATDPASFERALDHTVDYVYSAADPTVLPREAVAPLVDWVVRRLAGQSTPPFPEVRLGRLPNVTGHALYVVLNQDDVDTVREAIAPGQIWVDATALDHDAWQIVGSAVQVQRRLLGQPLGHPGRPKRPADPIRDEVAVRVARAKDNNAAWDIVVAAGLKTGPLYDRSDPRLYPRNRAFLDRLRRRGGKLLRTGIAAVLPVP